MAGNKLSVAYHLYTYTFTIYLPLSYSNVRTQAIYLSHLCQGIIESFGFYTFKNICVWYLLTLNVLKI